MDLWRNRLSLKTVTVEVGMKTGKEGWHTDGAGLGLESETTIIVGYSTNKVQETGDIVQMEGEGI